MKCYLDRDQAVNSEPGNSALSHFKAPPFYSSQELFTHGSEIRIEHKGAVYTLRITRSGGLILNK